MRNLFLALAMLLTAASAASAQVQAPSTWTNDGGSVLTITSVDNKGTIQGTFVNNNKNFECVGKQYPAKGKALANDTYFAVTFSDCDTVTIWHSKVQGSKMKAPWKLWYAGSDGAFHALTGTDTFTRTSP